MEKYLSKCLNSICNNTYRNLEIICINDGSTDSSLEILKELEKKDERIIIINQSNKKVSASRNIGLDIAKGEWISMIDPDDWIHTQFFETLLSIAKKENAHITMCKTKITTSRTNPPDEMLDIPGTKYRTVSIDELNRLHIEKSRIWGKLYRKDVIGNLRFISGAEPVEDKSFNTMLFSKWMKFCIVEHALYNYYIRKDSAVQTNTGRQSLVYTQHMIPFISEETDSEKRQRIIEQCYNVLLSARYLEKFSKNYQEVKKEIDTELSKLVQYRRHLSIKNRIIYSVLCKIPALYRAWRIAKDPTLLQYESNQKKYFHQ